MKTPSCIANSAVPAKLQRGMTVYRTTESKDACQLADGCFQTFAPRMLCTETLHETLHGNLAMSQVLACQAMHLHNLLGSAQSSVASQGLLACRASNSAMTRPHQT